MGPPLFEAFIANSMLVCVDIDVFLHWNSAAEEGAWVGLKPDLQGGTGFQPGEGPFLDPRAKGNRVQKRVRKWTRLKSKVVPLEGPVLVPFWPLHCGKSVEAFISSRS